MKKLFLSAVAAMLAVTAFSQKIQVHVTKINTSLIQWDTLRYSDVYEDVNTTYTFDLDKQTMSADFPFGDDITDKPIQIEVKDKEYYISFKDKTLDLFRDLDVQIIIDSSQEKPTITWNQQYMLDEQRNIKSLTIIKFIDFEML
jgi:hypothetical protein